MDEDYDNKITSNCGCNKKSAHGGADDIDQKINEREQLVDYLDDSANPNPLAVTFMVVLCFCILYVLYLVFIKSSMEGTWFDQNERVWDIAHGKINDRIYLTGPRGQSIEGQIQGAGIFLDNGCTGIWDYNDSVEIYDRGNPLLFLQRVQN
jgi:hypothetical protein